MLGLTHKGHLGPGADGDVTIYAPDADKERMFALPRYLIKAGEVVLDDGDLRAAPDGRTLHVAPEFDPRRRARDRGVVRRHYSIQFANYPVGDPDVANPTAVPCLRAAEGREAESEGSPPREHPAASRSPTPSPRPSR